MANATVLANASNEGADHSSERSKSVPGFMAAYATPPTTGARQRFTYQGAILPVNARTTKVPAGMEWGCMSIRVYDCMGVRVWVAERMGVRLIVWWTTDQ